MIIFKNKELKVLEEIFVPLLIGLSVMLITAKSFAQSTGLDTYKSVDVDETEEEIKATKGSLFGYFLFNKHASAIRYFKFYNATAADTTVGTTVPKLTIPVPAQGGANVFISPSVYLANGPYIASGIYINGVLFDTALSIACTTGVADNDTGAPADNDCIADIYYK